jgi:hypothetical protein
MIADELRSRLRAMPFKPFTVVKADGGRVHVHHHDYAWVLPTGGELYVQDRDGKVHWIYTTHITELVHDEEPGETARVAEEPPG